MRESSTTTGDMEREARCTLVGTSTRGTGSMDRGTVRGHSSVQMERFMT